ncbi:MAG: DNA repair protein RadA [Candidatus Thioglobus sp. MED-G23]|nr:MAG: DNA repair protein RadA [Candidatus Thioglobus sp. MED-G23]
MAKARTRTLYVCSHCGTKSHKWVGQCSSCGSWNTLGLVTATGVSPGLSSDSVTPARLADVVTRNYERYPTGLSELDRVLGGGLVPGSVVLLGGEPGIGKSTLALQALGCLSNMHETLYVSAEESVEQLAMRYQRLGVSSQKLTALCDGQLETLIAELDRTPYGVLVVDSIQTLRTQELESSPGSVGQVRECADRLVVEAKRRGISIILIGHVTKEGALAGPKTLEHLVDTVLYFEGDTTSRFRLVRAWKNRFGSVNEVGVFAMEPNGLKAVKNPSAIFLSGTQMESAGTAIFVSQDGTRPMLVEVQALVDQSSLGNPRRLSVGYETHRLNMLLAILHRHAGISLLDQDVFVNVAGGLRVIETGADLAVAAAIISSFANKPIDRRTVFFGELGLSGEVRPVPRGEERVAESAKLGFSRLVIPAANKLESRKVVEGLSVAALRSAVELDSVVREQGG